MDEKKRRIGLVVDYLTSEYSENLMDGVSAYCREHDINPFFFPIGELNNIPTNDCNYQFVSAVAHIKKENVDGLIIVSSQQMHKTSREGFDAFLDNFKSIPMVNISAQLPGIPSVSVNYEQGFDSLIQYLIEYQHCRKFAFIGVSSNSTDVKKRTEIFNNVLSRNDIPLDSVVYWNTNFEYSGSYHTIENWYKKNGHFDFDAIVSLNDDMAFACIDFCQNQLMLKIPEDLIVTGFDDIRRSSISQPTLTSVNQRISEQAYIAAKTLCKMLDGESVPMLQTIEGKAIIRQSSQKYPLENIPDYLKTASIETHYQANDRFTVFEWYKKREQIFQAAYFYSELNYDTDIKNIGELLTRELKNYGFHSVAIVIYEKPIEMSGPFTSFELPDNAILIGGFDYQTGFNTNYPFLPQFFFPKKKLVPDGFLKYTPDGFIVSSLFHNHFQYGYLVIRRDNFDLGVYSLIFKAIGNQVAACFSYKNIVDEKSKITDKYQKMDIIVHTDYLTGLRNRRGFIEFGSSFMNLAQSMSQRGLIIYCDMDGLKKINDNFGHESGDTAIKSLAVIIKKNFRENDIVAHLSGDEFAVLSPTLSVEHFFTIKDKISADCKTWALEEKVPYTLSVSMGYAEYPSSETGYDLKALLAQADSSLYIEKQAKKNKK